jgi:hypothetical protein
LNHRVIVPSVTVSPNCGSVMSAMSLLWLLPQVYGGPDGCAKLLRH